MLCAGRLHHSADLVFVDGGVSLGGDDSYGLSEGYDKLVVADIIVLLIEALKSIGATDNKLIQAHTKADQHNPSSPDAA